MLMYNLKLLNLAALVQPFATYHLERLRHPTTVNKSGSTKSKNAMDFEKLDKYRVFHPN